MQPLKADSQHPRKLYLEHNFQIICAVSLIAVLGVASVTPAFPKLAQALNLSPRNTGLLITNNQKMEAIGSGLVILVDGREIKDTNLTQIELGQPISINHLVTHVMSKFDTFDLKSHKMKIHNSQYVT